MQQQKPLPFTRRSSVLQDTSPFFLFLSAKILRDNAQSPTGKKCDETKRIQEVLFYFFVKLAGGKKKKARIPIFVLLYTLNSEFKRVGNLNRRRIFSALFHFVALFFLFY